MSNPRTRKTNTKPHFFASPLAEALRHRPSLESKPTLEAVFPDRETPAQFLARKTRQSNFALVKEAFDAQSYDRVAQRTTLSTASALACALDAYNRQQHASADAFLEAAARRYAAMTRGADLFASLRYLAKR